MKKCPHCAKEIQDEAIKCRHCKQILNNKGDVKNEDSTKKCPYCAEDIKVEAIKCKHCGELLFKSRVNNADLGNKKMVSIEYKKQCNNLSLAWGVPGLLLQTIGSFGVYDTTTDTMAISLNSPVMVLALLVGTGLLITGLGYYSKSKGYRALYGWLGLVPFLMGMIILALLPDKLKISPEKPTIVSSGETTQNKIRSSNNNIYIIMFVFIAIIGGVVAAYKLFDFSKEVASKAESKSSIAKQSNMASINKNTEERKIAYEETVEYDSRGNVVGTSTTKQVVDDGSKARSSTDDNMQDDRQILKIKGLYIGMNIDEAAQILRKLLGRPFEVRELTETEQQFNSFDRNLPIKYAIWGKGTSLAIYAEKDKSVIRIILPSYAIDTFFNVSGVNAQDFAKQFADGYKLPEMEYFTDNYGQRGWEHISTNGYKIQIYEGMLLVITKFPKKNEMNFD